MSPSQPHWESLHLELLHIYDAEVLPWGRKFQDVPPASFYRAWLLRSGHGRVKVGTRWLTLSPGEWMVPSPLLSAQEFSDDARLLSLHFHARWPDGSLLFDVGAGLKWKAAEHPKLESTARAMLKICRSGEPRYWRPAFPENLPLDQHLHVAEKFRGWLRIFYAIMTSQGVPPTSLAVLDKRVRAGLKWLNQLPLGTKFREPLLAEKLGMSVIHLNRLFAREIKISPAAYMEQRRWDRAVHLLLNSDLSAKEIAYELGFCAPSYFTSWVKNRSGKTPLEFRNRDE
jgi:AraC-like DNA-binding protein